MPGIDLFILVHGATGMLRVPLIQARTAQGLPRAPPCLLFPRSWQPEGSTHPKKLAGRFIGPPDDDEDDLEMDLLHNVDFDDEEEDDEEAFNFLRDDIESDEVESSDWNRRSASARALYDDPVRKAEILKKRQATRMKNAKVQKAAAAAAAKRANPKSPAARKISEAHKFYHSDRENWVAQRLESGAEMRRRIYDEEYKRELQLKRAESARRVYARRRANAAKAAKEPKPKNEDETSA